MSTYDQDFTLGFNEARSGKDALPPFVTRERRNAYLSGYEAGSSLYGLLDAEDELFYRDMMRGGGQ